MDEERIKNDGSMTIAHYDADWEERLNRFIAATDREILQDAGKVSAEIAKA